MEDNFDYESALKEFNEFNDEKKKELEDLLSANQAKLDELADKKQEIDGLKSQLVDSEKNMQELRGLLYDLEKEEYDDLKQEIDEKEKIYKEEAAKLAPVLSDLKLKISYELGNFIKKRDVDNSENLYQEEADRLNEEISKIESERNDLYEQRDDAQSELVELTKELAKGMKLEDSKDIRDQMGDLSQKIYDLNLELDNVEAKLALNKGFLAELELAHDNYKVIAKNTPEYDEYAKLILISDVLNDVNPENVKSEPASSEPVKTGADDSEPTKPEPASSEPVKTAPADTEPVKTGADSSEPAKTEPVKPEAGNNNPAMGMDEYQRDVEFDNLISEFIAEVKIITSNSIDDRVEEIFEDIKAEYMKKYADSNTRDAKMSEELREKFNGYMAEITAAVDWENDDNVNKANRFFERWANQALVRFFGEVAERVDENGNPVEEQEKAEKPAQQEKAAQPTSLSPALRHDMTEIGTKTVDEDTVYLYQDNDGKIYIYDENNDTLEYSEEETQKANPEKVDDASIESSVEEAEESAPVPEPEHTNTDDEVDIDEKFDEDLEKLNQLLLNSYPDKAEEINKIIYNVKRLGSYRDLIPDLSQEFADRIKGSIESKILSERGERFEGLSEEFESAVNDVAGYFEDNNISLDVESFPELDNIISYSIDLNEEIIESEASEEEIITGVAGVKSALASCLYYDYLNDKSKIKEKYEALVQRLSVDKVDELFEKRYGREDEEKDPIIENGEQNSSSSETVVKEEDSGSFNPEDKDAYEKFKQDLDNLKQMLIDAYPNKVENINEIIPKIERVGVYRDFIGNIQNEIQEQINWDLSYYFQNDIKIAMPAEIQDAVAEVTKYFNNTKLNEDYKNIPEVEKFNDFIEELSEKISKTHKFDWQVRDFAVACKRLITSVYYRNLLNNKTEMKELIDNRLLLEDKSIVDEVFEEHYGREEEEQDLDEDVVKSEQPIESSDSQPKPASKNPEDKELDDLIAEIFATPASEPAAKTEAEPASEPAAKPEPEPVSKSTTETKITTVEEMDKEFKKDLKKLYEYLKEVNIAENDDSIKSIIEEFAANYADENFSEKAQKSAVAKKMKDLYDKIGDLYSECVYTSDLENDEKRIDYIEILTLKVLGDFSRKVDYCRGKIVDDQESSKLALETLNALWDRIVPEDFNDKHAPQILDLNINAEKETHHDKDGKEVNTYTLDSKQLSKLIEAVQLDDFPKMVPDFTAVSRTLDIQTTLLLVERASNMYNLIAKYARENNITFEEAAAEGMTRKEEYTIDVGKLANLFRTLSNEVVPEDIVKLNNNFEYSNFITSIIDRVKNGTPDNSEEKTEFTSMTTLALMANFMRNIDVDALGKPEIEKETAKEDLGEKTESDETEKADNSDKKVEPAEAAKKEPEKTSEEKVSKEESPEEIKRIALIMQLKQYKEIIFGSINSLNDNEETRKNIETKLMEIVELYDSLKPITFEDFDKKMKTIRDYSVLTDVQVAKLSYIEKELKDDFLVNQFVLGKNQEDDELDEYFDYKSEKNARKFSEVSLETEKETDVVANEKDMPDLFLKFVNAQAVEDAIREVEEFIGDKTKPKTYKGPKGLFEVLKTKAELFKQNAFLYRVLRRKRQNGDKGDTPLEALKKLKNPAERQSTMNEVTKIIRKEIEDLRSGAILPSAKSGLSRLMSKTIYKHKTNSFGMELYDKFTLAGELMGERQYKVKKRLLEEARKYVLRTMRETGEDGFYAEFSGKEETVYSPRNGQKLTFSRLNGEVAPEEPGLKHVFYESVLDQLDVNIRIQEAYRAEKEAQKEAEEIETEKDTYER